MSRKSQQQCHICMLSLAFFVIFVLVYQNIHTHPYMCCLFPSVYLCVCLCVCVCCMLMWLLSVFLCVCLRYPLPGSFDLFNASNGTSKEDFSEFDSLRSSSSVPTGTHPCLRLSIDNGVCVVFSSVSEMMPVCGAQTRTCLVFCM